MKRALLLCLALAWNPIAQATTAPTLNLSQQARKADVIIRATLGTPTTAQDGEHTYVAYPLTVTETLAGDPATLPQLEGKPALYFLQGLSDLPAMSAGQDAIIMLYARRLDSPLVGFNQGLYPIVNGQVTFPGKTMLSTPTVTSNPPSPATNPTPGATGTVSPTPSPASPPTPAVVSSPAATPTPDPNAFDPAWSDPAKFRQAILNARSGK